MTKILIPPDMALGLYRDVKPLRELMDEMAGLAGMDVLSPEYSDAIRDEMEKYFPNLREFSRVIEAYFLGAGHGLSREEGWPYVQEFANHIIGDHGLDV